MKGLLKKSRCLLAVVLSVVLVSGLIPGRGYEEVYAALTTGNVNLEIAGGEYALIGYSLGADDVVPAVNIDVSRVIYIVPQGHDVEVGKTIADAGGNGTYELLAPSAVPGSELEETEGHFILRPSREVGTMPTTDIVTYTITVQMDVKTFDFGAQSAPSEVNYFKPEAAPDSLNIIPVTDTGTPEVPTLGMDFRFRLSGVPIGYSVDNDKTVVRFNDGRETPIGNDENGVYTIKKDDINDFNILVRYKADKNLPDPASDVSEDIVNAKYGGSWNIFYTTYYGHDAMKIDLPEGADISKSYGTWREYYDIDQNGVVKVIPTDAKTRKKAVSSSRKKVKIPICDGNGNQTDTYTVSLPVTYSKPDLQLTKTSDRLNTEIGERRKFSTKVTIKKASNKYQPLDISRQRKDVNISQLKNKSSRTSDPGPTVTIPGQDSEGEIQVETANTLAGYFNVWLDNWSEGVKLKYSVNGVSRDVITLSYNGGEYTQRADISLNKNAPTPGKDHVLKIRVNEETPEEGAVTLRRPKKEGGVIAELSGDTFRVKYPEDPSSLEKGTYYYYLITAANSNVCIKVVVRDQELSKAITPIVRQKMNSVLRKCAIVEPKLKYISGDIEGVSVEDDRFSATYDKYNNYIYIFVKPEATPPASNVVTYLNINVGGVICPTRLTIIPKVDAPSINISKLTFPKSELINGTAEGEASMKVSFSAEGRAYEVKPTSIQFEKSTPVGDGWYKIKISSKMSVLVKYNADKDTISVRSDKNADAKSCKIKASLYFAGSLKAYKATLAIDVNKRL